MFEGDCMMECVCRFTCMLTNHVNFNARNTQLSLETELEGDRERRT